MIMAIFLTMGLVHAQQEGIQVHADESVSENINFSRYKTFAVVSKSHDVMNDAKDHPDKADKKNWKEETLGMDERNRDDNSFQVSQTALETVKKEIVSEMEERGYTKQEDNPDLLVNYTVMTGETTIPGFQSDDSPGSSGARTPDDRMNIATEPGTIFISILDPRRGEVVWQGFASGLAEDKDRFTADEDRIDAAVSLLFDEYKQRGDRYSVR